MPRTSRGSIGDQCYHVINRGNRRSTVFHRQSDYADFERLMFQASIRIPMRILAYCLMPNHFHFVLWPRGDRDLSRWMHWLMTTHVRRYRSGYKSIGRIWQGRFKAFPVQTDSYLLGVLRYVERNPVRAQLVHRAEEWKWSSQKWWGIANRPECLVDDLAEKPDNWNLFVNETQDQFEITAIRESVNRESPFGEQKWRLETAKKLGLESTLRRAERAEL